MSHARGGDVPVSSPLAAPLASWLSPEHFPASRSGLIGRAHAEGAPGWVLSLLRSLPPDGHYYQHLEELTGFLAVGTQTGRTAPRPGHVVRPAVPIP